MRLQPNCVGLCCNLLVVVVWSDYAKWELIKYGQATICTAY